MTLEEQKQLAVRLLVETRIIDDVENLRRSYQSDILDGKEELLSFPELTRKYVDLFDSALNSRDTDLLWKHFPKFATIYVDSYVRTNYGIAEFDEKQRGIIKSIAKRALLLHVRSVFRHCSTEKDNNAWPYYIKSI